MAILEKCNVFDLHALDVQKAVNNVVQVVEKGKEETRDKWRLHFIYLVGHFLF